MRIFRYKMPRREGWDVRVLGLSNSGEHADQLTDSSTTHNLLLDPKMRHTAQIVQMNTKFLAECLGVSTREGKPTWDESY